MVEGKQRPDLRSAFAECVAQTKLYLSEQVRGGKWLVSDASTFAFYRDRVQQKRVSLSGSPLASSTPIPSREVLEATTGSKGCADAEETKGFSLTQPGDHTGLKALVASTKSASESPAVIIIFDDPPDSDAQPLVKSLMQALRFEGINSSLQRRLQVSDASGSTFYIRLGGSSVSGYPATLSLPHPLEWSKDPAAKAQIWSEIQKALRAANVCC